MTLDITVKDGSGTALEGVEVTIINDLLGTSSSRYTDGNGYTNHVMIGAGGTLCTLTTSGYRFDQPYYTLTDALTQQIALTATPSFKRPSVDVIRRFRGNFCGLVLPYLQYGPQVDGGRVLFTPGIVCETPDVRRQAFRDYKAAGLTHFPLNLTNHSPVYHGFYPDWDDSIINDVLIDAWRAGLIPGGAFMGDDDDTLDCQAAARLVGWGFPKWEQNGPDHDDTPTINRHFLACRAAYPDVPTYFHFTSRHAAGGSPEGDWWNWAWQNGARGILYQHDLWSSTPQDVADRCEDFLVRFQNPTQYLGWPKGPDFVIYEDEALPVFHGELSPAVANEQNRQLWALITRGQYTAIGYCNGV